MVFGKRLALMLAALGVLSSCGSTPQQTGNGRPKSPLDLPPVAANLDLTGPVSGHVSEVRFGECKKRPKPDGNFYASIYFELEATWYFLQLIAVGGIPVTGNDSGYNGPGRYQAEVDFRDMSVYPGGMINGAHAWGGPIDLIQVLSVAPDGHAVSVGGATGTPFDPVFTNDLILWPERTDQTGPPALPRPAPDQVVTIRGSWHCP